MIQQLGDQSTGYRPIVNSIGNRRPDQSAGPQRRHPGRPALETGRGFAVVADGSANWPSVTPKATDEITRRMVAAIQNSTGRRGDDEQDVDPGAGWRQLAGRPATSMDRFAPVPTQVVGAIRRYFGSAARAGARAPRSPATSNISPDGRAEAPVRDTAETATAGRVWPRTGATRCPLPDLIAGLQPPPGAILRRQGVFGHSAGSVTGRARFEHPGAQRRGHGDDQYGPGHEFRRSGLKTRSPPAAFTASSIHS